METIGAALRQAAVRLADAGVDDVDREAVWLLAHVLGTSAGAVRLRAHEPLPAESREAFAALVERRARREPLQYILGTEEFMGMTFKVTPDVLIPRLDTEVLVREAAARLHGRVRVADIGTGSGAIAVALARLLPEATVVAVDISPDALAVARENAAANGVADRVEFRSGDLLEPLQGERFDAVLSNPPYIGEEELTGLMPEVRCYEPRLALTPGADGLLMYRRLCEGAPAVLKPGGFLAVEVGAGQADRVRAIFAQRGYTVAVFSDTAGIQRVVLGRTP